MCGVSRGLGSLTMQQDQNALRQLASSLCFDA